MVSGTDWNDPDILEKLEPAARVGKILKNPVRAMLVAGLAKRPSHEVLKDVMAQTGLSRQGIQGQLGKLKLHGVITAPGYRGGREGYRLTEYGTVVVYRSLLVSLIAAKHIGALEQAQKAREFGVPSEVLDACEQASYACTALFDRACELPSGPARTQALEGILEQARAIA